MIPIHKFGVDILDLANAQFRSEGAAYGKILVSRKTQAQIFYDNNETIIATTVMVEFELATGVVPGYLVGFYGLGAGWTFWGGTEHPLQRPREALFLLDHLNLWLLFRNRPHWALAPSPNA